MAKETTTTTKKTTAKSAPKKAAKVAGKKSVSKKVATRKPVAKASTKSVAKKATKPVEISVKKDVKPAFAVIEIAGTQLRVEEGKKYEINKIDGAKGEKVSLDLYKILMLSDGKSADLGKPYVDGAKVELKIDSQKRDKKIETRHFKSKSRYRRKTAIRPLITRIEVTKIA